MGKIFTHIKNGFKNLKNNECVQAIILVIVCSSFIGSLSKQGIEKIRTFFLPHYFNYLNPVGFICVAIITSLITYTLIRKRYIKVLCFEFLCTWIFIAYLIRYFHIAGTSIIAYLYILFLLVKLYWIFYEIKTKTNPKHEKDKKLKTSSSIGFLEDNPILNYNQDLFKRNELAKSLLLLIKQTETKSSFGILLYGPWGNGKTSFLNLMETSTENLPIIAKFNPWTLDSDSIIEQLFHAINENINDEELEGYFKNLLIALQADSSSINLKIITSSILSYLNSNNIQFYKDKIAEKIKDKKMLLILDDLDRVTKEEVIDLLKVLRNHLNIPNLFYIVGADNNYLKNLLPKENNHSFLDKFFQLRLELPIFEDSYFVLKFIEILEKLKVKEDDYISWLGTIDSPKDPDVFVKLVTSERDFKSIYNSFILLHSILNNEVDTIKLIKLEILRIKENNLYNYLRVNFYAIEDYYNNIRGNIIYSNVEDNRSIIEKVMPDLAVYMPDLVDSNIEDERNYPLNVKRYHNLYFRYYVDKSKLISKEEYQDLFSFPEVQFNKLDEIAKNPNKTNDLIHYHLYDEFKNNEIKSVENAESKIIAMIYVDLHSKSNSSFDISYIVRQFFSSLKNPKHLENNIINLDNFSEFEKILIYGDYFLLGDENYTAFYQRVFVYINNVNLVYDCNLKEIYIRFPIRYKNLQNDKIHIDNEKIFLSTLFSKNPIAFLRIFMVKNMYGYGFFGEPVEDIVLNYEKFQNNNSDLIIDPEKKELMEFFTLFKKTDFSKSNNFGFHYINFEFKYFNLMCDKY